jgi:hypothetical protein
MDSNILKEYNEQRNEVFKIILKRLEKEDKFCFSADCADLLKLYFRLDDQINQLKYKRK